MWQGLEQAAGAGKLAYADLLGASDTVLAAELELSDNPAAQATAYEKRVALARRVEKMMDGQQENSKVGVVDGERVRYMRWDAEVHWLRAKQKANPKPAPK